MSVSSLVLILLAPGAALVPTSQPTSCPDDLRVTSAQFDNDGDSVSVSYSTPTNQAGLVIGERVSCTVLFRGGFENDEECYFMSSSSVRAEVRSAIPGNEFSIVEGSVSARCGAAVEPGQSVTILEPAVPLIPEVIIAAPSRVPRCEGVVEVDASQSTGLGGREAVARVRAIDAATGRVLFSNTTTSLKYALIEFGDSSTITVSVELTNFFGESSSASVDVELSDGVDIPNVRIVGTRPTRRYEILEVQTKAEASNCNNRSRADRGVDYLFTLETFPGREVVANASESRDPRVFRLLPYALDIGQYLFTVTAVDRATLATNNATAVVEVVESDLVVILRGGNRTTSRDSITLSGADSYDPDDLDASLDFQWVYSSSDSSYEESFVSEGAVLQLANLTDGVYDFTLTVSSSSSESKSSSATTTVYVVSTIDGAFEGDARIVPFGGSTSTTLSTRVWPPNARLILNATTSSSSSSSSNAWTWTVDQTFNDGLNLSQAALTPISTTPDGLFQLAIAANSMIGGVLYTFRLSSDDAFAFVEVLAANPPSSGILDVSPESGFSLTTEFALLTSRWTSDAWPLHYRYETRDPSTNEPSKILKSATLETSLTGAILSADDQTLLAVVATDSLGAKASATKTIAVFEDDSVTDDVASSIAAEAISDAFVFSDKETIAQVAVTASSRLTDDSATRESLVGNLLESWLLYDFEPDQIAAFAAAMLAPVSNPDVIGSRVARSALQQTLGVASRYAEGQTDETVDDLSALDMTAIVSNILQTSLFNETDGGIVDDDFTSGLDDDNQTHSGRNISDLVSSTVDALMAARLRNRAVDESRTEVIEAGIVRLGTRRVSGLQSVDLDLDGDQETVEYVARRRRRRRLQNGADDDSSSLSTARVIVPELGVTADLSLAEYLVNPNRITRDGGGVSGTVLRFDLSLLAPTGSGSSMGNAEDYGDDYSIRGLSAGDDLDDNVETTEVTFVVPAINKTEDELLDTRANVTLICDWNFLGTVTGVCPTTGEMLSYECNETKNYEEVILGCGEVVQRTCVNYAVARETWISDNCVIDESLSTEDEDYCVCQVPMSTSADDDDDEISTSRDYSTLALLSDYSRPYQREIGRSSVDVDRALVMLIFLCVYILLFFVIIVCVRYRDKRRFKAANEFAQSDTPAASSSRSRSFWSAGSASAHKSQLQTTNTALKKSKSEVHRDVYKLELKRMMETAHTQHENGLCPRLMAVLGEKHPVCGAFRYDPNPAHSSRAMRIFVLAVETLMIFAAVAVENQFAYPDEGCHGKRSEENCHRLTSSGGRKLCKWDQSEGTCEIRGPPNYSLYSVEHFVIVLITTAILLPCICVFEWACLSVLSRATVKYQLSGQSYRPATKRVDVEEDIEKKGGGPTGAESFDGTGVSFRDDTADGKGASATQATSDAPKAQKTSSTAPSAQILSDSRRGKVPFKSLLARQGTLPPEVENHRGFKVLRSLPPEFAAAAKPQPVALRIKRRRALRTDKELYDEAVSLAPGVADAVRMRREELRSAMRYAQGLDTARGKRMAYILFELEQDLTRSWGVIADNDAFEAQVALIVFNHLRVARLWRIELAVIPEDDSELRALFLANKMRVQQLSSVERRVYEQLYESQLPDVAFSEPRFFTWLCACLVCIIACGFPIIYLLSYATDVGRAETTNFFVDAVFESLLVFGVVMPIMYFLRHVFFPTLIADKIERMATLSKDCATHYPFKEPLKEDALDYLVDEFPGMEQELAELSTPCRPAKASLAKGNDYNISRSLSAEEAYLPTLEELEDIHRHATWKPLWTSASVLFAASAFLFLPDTIQEITIEELALLIPMLAFGFTSLLTTRSDPNGLAIISVAILLAWGCVIFMFGTCCGIMHNRARQSRRLQIKQHMSSLAINFPMDADDIRLRSLGSDPSPSMVYCDSGSLDEGVIDEDRAMPSDKHDGEEIKE